MQTHRPNDMAANSPKVDLIRPLWRALGWEIDRQGERRYWFDINGRVCRYRAPTMSGIGWLSTIYPDLEYWRRMFPWHSRRIDTVKAVSYFTKACEAAGPYSPVSVAESPPSPPK